MDRKGGAATVAVLLTILGVAYLPRKGQQSTTAPEAVKQTQQAATAQLTKSAERNASTPSSGCQQIGVHVSRFYAKSMPYPDVCYRGNANPAKAPSATLPPDLHFVIAIVPNPVQTHQPLLFDRSIEVIQQAAQDENYVYDGSWFPWSQSSRSYQSYEDQQESEESRRELQKQPGVLAFRQGLLGAEKDPYNGGLIVFVVGEQPTGGLQNAQFQNALQWIRALPTVNKEQLLVLGPMFSGSLTSLAHELSDEVIRQYPQGVRVYSGSVNSEESVRWFRDSLQEKENKLQAAGYKGSLEFRTFLEGDTLMTERFLCFLKQEKYPLERVAILSEDQTAYGGQARAPLTKPTPKAKLAPKAKPTPTKDASPEPAAGCTIDPSPIYLYYPRDIATLRSAYEQQSIFTAGKQQANAPSTSLRGTLSEEDTAEHDAVRTYGGQLTPWAQESVLFAIANLMEAKHIEFIIVRSSSSLDQLFLSEFLRRAYPDGRVVLDGSDLLLRRGMEGASLRGVMLLSTYPLLSWTQDAVPVLKSDGKGGYEFPLPSRDGTPTPRGSYRVFSEDLAEGTYIAARELIPSLGQETIPISDYAPPRSILCKEKKEACRDDRRPATWVSVVGHRQFWSLAVLNSNTLEQEDDPNPPDTPDKSLLKTEPASQPAKRADSAKSAAKPDKPPPKRGRFPGEMTALLIFCAALALWHGFLCWKGSIIGTPRARAYFAPIPKAQQPALIFLGSLILGALGLTLIATTGVLGNSLGVSQSRWFAAVVATIILSGFVGFVKNYTLPVLAGVEKATATAGSPASPGENAPKDAESADGGEAVPPRNRASDAAASRNPVLHSINAFMARLGRREIPSWVLALAWLVALGILAYLRFHYLNSHLTSANKTSTFWRNLHLRSGVSGLLPQVLLVLGMYSWFWSTLRGLSLFGDDRPVLPSSKSLPHLTFTDRGQLVLESDDDLRRKNRGPLPHAGDKGGTDVFRMFSQEDAGMKIESTATPLGRIYVMPFPIILAGSVLVCWTALGESALRTLGDRTFGRLIFFCICLSVAVILTDTLQFLRTWGCLRQLLVFFDRLRLRRTLSCFAGLTWKSVWSMGSNVLEERYKLISRQMESAQNLRNALTQWEPKTEEDTEHKRVAVQQLGDCEKHALEFTQWYVKLLGGKLPRDIAPLKQYQEALARTAGSMMTHVILPAWQQESHSLILQPLPKAEGKEPEPLPAPAPHVRAAEEFFVLPYLGFIQNILGRVRTIVIGVLWLFVATTLALSSYPFDPLQVIGAIFLILFVMVGATIVFVYAEMHRDATLSRITNTRPGELGFEFWGKIFAFGVGPLIGLLTTLFPSMTDFVVSVLQPGAQAIK